MEYSWVRIVSLGLRLTKVNYVFMIAMTMVFVALKTLYLNVVPQFLGVHSMLIESLLVSQVACENLISLLPLAQDVPTFSSLSWVSKVPRFSSVFNAYLSKLVLKHHQWYHFR